MHSCLHRRCSNFQVFYDIPIRKDKGNKKEKKIHMNILTTFEMEYFHAQSAGGLARFSGEKFTLRGMQSPELSFL